MMASVHSVIPYDTLPHFIIFSRSHSIIHSHLFCVYLSLCLPSPAVFFVIFFLPFPFFFPSSPTISLLSSFLLFFFSSFFLFSFFFFTWLILQCQPYLQHPPPTSLLLLPLTLINLRRHLPLLLPHLPLPLLLLRLFRPRKQQRQLLLPRQLQSLLQRLQSLLLQTAALPLSPRLRLRCLLLQPLSQSHRSRLPPLPPLPIPPASLLLSQTTHPTPPPTPVAQTTTTSTTLTTERAPALP